MSRSIVAFMWSGARKVRSLADNEEDPSPQDLQAIADRLREENDRRQDGVTPTVRIVASRRVRRPEPPDLAA